jgi:hypothetical protein
MENVYKALSLDCVRESVFIVNGAQGPVRILLRCTSLVLLLVALVYMI